MLFIPSSILPKLREAGRKRIVVAVDDR